MTADRNEILLLARFVEVLRLFIFKDKMKHILTQKTFLLLNHQPHTLPLHLVLYTVSSSVSVIYKAGCKELTTHAPTNVK